MALLFLKCSHPAHLQVLYLPWPWHSWLHLKYKTEIAYWKSFLQQKLVIATVTVALKARKYLKPWEPKLVKAKKIWNIRDMIHIRMWAWSAHTYGAKDVKGVTRDQNLPLTSQMCSSMSKHCKHNHALIHAKHKFLSEKKCYLHCEKDRCRFYISTTIKTC